MKNRFRSKNKFVNKYRKIKKPLINFIFRFLKGVGVTFLFVVVALMISIAIVLTDAQAISLLKIMENYFNNLFTFL